jgi:hypothetical protein
MLEAAAILARLDAIMRELAELRNEVAASLRPVEGSHGVFPPSAPWLLGRSVLGAVEDHRLSELISKLSPQF